MKKDPAAQMGSPKPTIAHRGREGKRDFWTPHCCPPDPAPAPLPPRRPLLALGSPASSQARTRRRRWTPPARLPPSLAPPPTPAARFATASSPPPEAASSRHRLPYAAHLQRPLPAVTTTTSKLRTSLLSPSISSSSYSASPDMLAPQRPS